jgi:hypothetical protein
VSDVGAGCRLEALQRHVRGTADAAGGNCHRRLFAGGNEVCDGLRCYLVIQDQRVRHVAGQRDGGKILQRIVAEVDVNERVDRQWAIRSHQQRITVGGRVCDIFGTDAAASAGPVLDDHGAI